MSVTWGLCLMYEHRGKRYIFISFDVKRGQFCGVKQKDEEENNECVHVTEEAEDTHQ